jgi:hypothetical protein
MERFYCTGCSLLANRTREVLCIVYVA